MRRVVRIVSVEQIRIALVNGNGTTAVPVRPTNLDDAPLGKFGVDMEINAFQTHTFAVVADPYLEPIAATVTA